ncbi:Uncharacterized protein At2g34460, chloroplastic [Coccomyxa sp. Obi]|nr:Uncharacterized protein At2g34460, chloroplastic [Coccomyxa sp. Obi]
MPIGLELPERGAAEARERHRQSLENVFEKTNAKRVIFAASGKTYFSAKDVDEQGVGNTAIAAKKLGLERVVLVSSALVTPKNRFHPIRLILNNIRWGLMDSKYRGENLLRESSVSYTIVRPGGLTNDPPGQRSLVVGQGDNAAGQVARSDVARVCVAALTDSDAKNVTLELSSKKDSVAPADELQSIFKGLKPDNAA